MNEGDIFWATDKQNARHAVVYFEEWEKDPNTFFVGLMLTHANISGNIKMESSHFEINDANGIAHNFQYDNTFVVNTKLIKSIDWGFVKSGELTQDGINFLKENINTNNAKLWADFLVQP